MKPDAMPETADQEVQRRYDALIAHIRAESHNISARCMRESDPVKNMELYTRATMLNVRLSVCLDEHEPYCEKMIAVSRFV